jgi:hypothetical protein
MLEVEISKVSKGSLVVLKSQLTYYMRPLRPFPSPAQSLFLIGTLIRVEICLYCLI